MLAKKYRGLTKKDVQLIFEKGQSKRAENLLIKFIPNNLDHPRFSLIAPTKDFPKATNRTEVRRILASCIEKFIEKLKNYDFAILLNTNADRRTNPKQIEINLEKIFTDNKLFKN